MSVQRIRSCTSAHNVIRSAGRRRKGKSQRAGLAATGLMEPLEERRLMSAPIVITAGGTYSGTWVSTNPNQAAVTIDTTQAVTLINSNISGEGNLIVTEISGVNLSVRNCMATGLNPNVAGDAVGVFLEADNAASIDVENTTISNVGGYALDVHGFTGTGSQTITILNNSFSNINGMYSNGNGGYETSGTATPHAIILNSVVGVAGINIGWNHIVNTAGQSYINDVINIYDSSGTAASPINIHNNCINGLWSPSPATIGDSGSGITTDGGTSPETAYVSITNNTILNCGNCGIAIAAGHDITVSGNICASTGFIPGTNTLVTSGNVGIYTWDQMSGGSISNYHNIVIGANTIGWMNNRDVRNDLWPGTTTGTTWAKDIPLPNSINDAEIGSLQAAWATSAAAAAGSPPIAAPPAASSSTTQGVALSSYYNRTGIFTDGQTSSNIGLDNYGNTYSASQLGSTVNWNGVTYTVGPANQNDVVAAVGQTITLPAGTHSAVDLIAAAVDGNQTNQALVMHYADGTSQTISQSFSDWIYPAGYSGETIVRSMSYRDGNNGSEQTQFKPYLYGYVLKLKPGETITSIMLPNDANIEILGMAVMA